MNRTAESTRTAKLAATTALAAALLAGCATSPAPRADLSAGKAEAALAQGKHGRAIEHAEAAVLAEPRNAAYRAMLGSAYLDAGRFASAVTTFDDAVKLGDSSPRTALSLALALIGIADYHQATVVLGQAEADIAADDLGLAYALAGEAERGIHIMSHAIRGGDNTPKMRQNLAYAYALAGRWKEARLMAAQDVPADKLGARIEEWAHMVQPQAWQARVAALLGAPVGVADRGQPVQLALANHPSVEELAGHAAAPAAPTEEIPPPPVLADNGELLPVGDSAPLTAVPAPAAAQAEPNGLQQAFAALAPAVAKLAQVTHDAMQFVQQPVIQPAPTRAVAAPKRAAAVPAARPARTTQAEGTHLVQLGSFLSEQSARRAWTTYTKRYPQLAGHKMVISQAVLDGKRYFRVSAAGFGQASSAALCGQLKTKGQGCIAYAESRPLPGAIDTGVRLARR
ncbi:tetratricopeptide repeat protein [Altererythrobacter soli]|uniref:Tetratricopeptide repeat protein n=1 Tax=Croceibacterium soli TaxID=1739690 RepID=A0A6I4USN4_9SPHN|nr:tetratricopeptide repeat protein [Croceibacterium soli]MXP41791.1 tetratricopeptide repeat protein [Croceibacterium soli]